MLSGKGIYIWILNQCENGNPAAITQIAQAAGLSHVLIKIADGPQPFNPGADAVTQALQASGIQVWGWHFVYGGQPDAEADIAIQRVQTLGLDGYVIDAEDPYKGKHAQAIRFSQRLRQGLPDTPIALSSFRFPEWHPELPWNEFLEICDLHMPQVYWEMSHNAAWQLQESKRQCDHLTNARPYIPTAPIYGRNAWSPSKKDILDFFTASQNLDLPAVNFYSWDYARAHLPNLWQVVADFDWPPAPQLPAKSADIQPPVGEQVAEVWLDALQQRAAARLLALYGQTAILQAGTRTYRRLSGLQGWFNHLLGELPHKAQVKKIAAHQSAPHIIHLSWEAHLDGSPLITAYETFVLNDMQQIILHYAFYQHADGTSPLLPSTPGLPLPI